MEKDDVGVEIREADCDLLEHISIEGEELLAVLLDLKVDERCQRTANVVPLFKKGSRDKPGNFRPTPEAPHQSCNSIHRNLQRQREISRGQRNREGDASPSQSVTGESLRLHKYHQWEILTSDSHIFGAKILPLLSGSETENVCSVISSLFSLLFLTVNLLAIVILSRRKCGLSTCTTRYLVAMATADLLVIIIDVILYKISDYYFPESFLNITPVCTVTYVLLRAATDCSVWFTVTFSFDRFVAICCQNLKTKYCTEKTAAVVLATSCILLCLKNIPFYFISEPGEIIDNVLWFCIEKPSYYREPGWVGFDWFNTVLTPLLPFAFILLLNALTVRHILVASRVRKGLRGQSKGENRSDPEMESRRKSVILLFTISGSFILLWMMYVINFLYYSLTGTGPVDYSHSEYIFEKVRDMLQVLSCCTNTFIYGVTQSKFREQVKNAVKYPVTSMIQLMNKQND
ncbi:probable G-protein coupled receptor 139 [Heterodontus francisci]|uniref:probable G-protein coupled receptor 139 n=1 Tax=Heterodontus francisci TaxID=7792 RepID=UPI00355B2C3D